MHLHESMRNTWPLLAYFKLRFVLIGSGYKLLGPELFSKHVSNQLISIAVRNVLDQKSFRTGKIMHLMRVDLSALACFFLNIYSLKLKRTELLFIPPLPPPQMCSISFFSV